MRGLSLQEAMRAVVMQVETGFPVPAKQKAQNKQPLSELDAFMILDPLLADLNKEFLDTKSKRAELLRKNGRDDPMAQIAEDLEDSAWCAMQTRYIELRSQRILMMKAQRLMRERDVEIETAKREEERRSLAAFAYHNAIIADQRRTKPMPDLLVWLLFFLWMEENRKQFMGFTVPANTKAAA